MTGIFGNMLTNDDGRSAFEYGDDILHRLASMVEHLEAMRDHSSRGYLVGGQQTDGTGAALISLSTDNSGDFDIERIVITAVGAGAVPADIFLNIPDNSTLIETLADVRKFADAPPAKLFLPQSQQLVIRITGATANTPVTVRCQIKRLSATEPARMNVAEWEGY